MWSLQPSNNTLLPSIGLESFMEGRSSLAKPYMWKNLETGMCCGRGFPLLYLFSVSGNQKIRPWKWKWKSLSCVPLFATPWTIHFVEFSWQEYWSGQASPSGDLPNPGIKPRSPAWQADSLPADPQGSQRILQYLNGPLFLSFKSLCTKPVIWWVNEFPVFCESL